MALLRRFTHPLLSLLPNLNEIPVRRQAVGALVASIALHFLLLLCIVFAAGLLPAHQLDFAKSRPALQELEVTLYERETPKLEIVTPQELLERSLEQPFIDSAGLAKSEEKPTDAAFESDQDMVAASATPGSGSEPLPTINGKDLPFQNFTTQDVVIGAADQPPGPEAPASPPTPVVTTRSPATIPKPAAPATPDSPSKLETEPPKPIAETKPADDSDLNPGPKATPPPLPKVDRVAPDQIAIATPERPAPKPTTKALPTRPRPEPVPADPAMEVARLTPPRPQPLPKPGFQAQQEKTKIEGSITNQGKAAVDAVRTPLAVYKKQVNAAIGSRWYYYVRQRRDLIAFGSVKVSYAITAAGKIVGINIVTNTSNQTLANICTQSIREAEIGPPPEEATASMVDGRLEGDLTFTYYDLH
ncbi:MAG: hypothetical protein ABI680_11540 [Chthoniobacteraceae bacterium]